MKIMKKKKDNVHAVGLCIYGDIEKYLWCKNHALHGRTI